jgi:hypothetical protein
METYHGTDLTQFTAFPKLQAFIEKSRSAPGSFEEFERALGEQMRAFENEVKAEQLARYDIDAQSIVVGGVQMNLFLKKEPFSLYYRFAPSELVQVVKLEPADLEPGALEIVKVMQDGHRFHGAVVGTALLLPPGGGGKLRVTFAPTRR